jgi:hypothetical protein
VRPLCVRPGEAARGPLLSAERWGARDKQLLCVCCERVCVLCA